MVMRIILLNLLGLLLMIPSTWAVNINNNTAHIEGSTKATLTLNGFQKGESGGEPSECDGQYHSDDDSIVALSTDWYNHGEMCFKCIQITRADGGQGTTKATVVDECDSKNGGCADDIVDGSKAVWKNLGFQESDPKYGEIKVTWDRC
ncbi:Putative ripening-related protein 7 [Linum perenne]